VSVCGSALALLPESAAEPQAARTSVLARAVAASSARRRDMRKTSVVVKVRLT